MKYKNYYRILSFFLLATSNISQIICMEKNKNKHTEFIRNLAIGSGAGIAEVTIDQPLICIKNMLQQGKKISLDPRKLYRGFGVNVACMGPTTAVQISSKKILEKMFPSSDLIPTITRSFGAGAISALASTPTELIVLQQQNDNTNAYNTIEKLLKEKDARVIMRGGMPKALRDGLFCIGLFSMYPMIKKYIRKNIKNSEIISTVGSSIIAGSGTAIATHPLDTISTTMQADYKKTHAKSMLQTIANIYKKDGIQGFYKGVTPRGTRVALAIPVINKAEDILRNTLEKK